MKENQYEWTIPYVATTTSQRFGTSKPYQWPQQRDTSVFTWTLNLVGRNTSNKNVIFLNSKFRKYYWLLGRHSKLSLENKRLVYLTVFKAIWTYGLPVWGTTKDCHREVIQRFQNKVLRAISDAPWFMSNKQLHNDLQVSTVNQTYQLHTERYIPFT